MGAALRFRRGAIAVAVSVACALTGCITPPAQRGEIAIASGASERLELAWRFGYVGTEGPEQPATATVLTRTDVLPAGGRARVGDVLLESRDVTLVLGAADGTDRAGTVVGAWSTRARVDELGSVRVVAYDRPVRATSVQPGVDGPSRAAWVDVIGFVDGPAGPIEIATRYDVAPGVRGVLVHSTFRVPAEVTDVELAVADVVSGEAPRREAAKAGGAPAALVVSGQGAGYALLAVDAPWAVVDVERGSHGIPAFALPTPPGELSIFSRFLAVLGRSDSLSVAVVQARGVGRGVGEIEIAAFDERGYPTALAKGTELVLDEHGSREGSLSFVVPRDLRVGESIVAEAPVGHFAVRRVGAPASEASGVHVQREQLARVRVRAATGR